MKKLSRILCMLLTVIMLFSIIAVAPVNAAETDRTEVPLETESATESAGVPAEGSEPSLRTEPLTESNTIPTVNASDDVTSMFSTRVTYENGKYRQKAVIWTTNGERVNYTYNGKVNSYSQLLMHTLWYDGEWRIAYCIEPGKTVYTSSDYDEVESNGVDPWGKLDYAKQRGVGLTLLYGYPNGLDSSDIKTQIAYQLATYLIIHEIILGWRQDVHPYARTNDHYFDVFGGGTPEKPESLEITSEFYSSIHTKRLNSEDIWYAYNHISNSLATHDLIPSFAHKFKNQAPVYTMLSNGDGTYSITLTDTNSILSAYDFEDTEDLTFAKSADGNSLTVTASNADLGTVSVEPTRSIPSIENSAYLIWNAETNSQELCTLKGAQNDPVPAYFKLKLPLGGIKVDKLASDGNVEGWQFGVYSDESCTTLVSGPLTTPASGSITIDNLPVGTYWVKELGHVTEGVADNYICASNNPECVTVTAGETTTVRFLNTLIPKGHLAVIKITDSGIDTMGWKFALYSDEACQNLVYGPVATDPYGIARFESIKIGTYWLKEIGNTNPEMCNYYTCMSKNPQQVTVIADDTVNVYFENKMNTGAITIQKTDPYHNALAGAHFLLEWSASGSIWTPVEYSPIPGWGKCTSPGIQNGILVTGSSGTISFQGLAVGLYYRITEVKAPNGFQLLGDYAHEGMLTANGEVITLNVVNVPVFMLPHTGSRSMIGMSAGLGLCLLTCLGAVYFLRKKES